MRGVLATLPVAGTERVQQEVQLLQGAKGTAGNQVSSNGFRLFGESQKLTEKVPYSIANV